MTRFEAAPIGAFLAIAVGATALLSGTLLVVARRLWKHALGVPAFALTLAIIRGTHPGPLRVNLLLVGIVLTAVAFALLTKRDALRAGYRPEMKGQFMRALAPAQQGQFMLVFGLGALLLAAFAIAVCTMIY
jgi:hypothetical protein